METSDYAAMRSHIKRLNARLGEHSPGTVKAFRALHEASMGDGALDGATKELIAVALAVAKQCDPCIAFHVPAALEHGATPEQLLDALAVTVMMGGGPSLMYAAHAIEAMEQATAKRSG